MNKTGNSVLFAGEYPISNTNIPVRYILMKNDDSENTGHALHGDKTNYIVCAVDYNIYASGTKPYLALNCFFRQVEKYKNSILSKYTYIEDRCDVFIRAYKKAVKSKPKKSEKARQEHLAVSIADEEFEMRVQLADLYTVSDTEKEKEICIGLLTKLDTINSEEDFIALCREAASIKEDTQKTFTAGTAPYKERGQFGKNYYI
ncbi:MAG: hypothetical protein LBU99_07050 [Spirochaetaceae bacterium]|jgi:hypothetical protein|nr:hypothetical protein [Spirochaetaceae bacterium]